MHYAAAARDGGHYLKILGKAGADPMAVDNVSTLEEIPHRKSLFQEGRTPDYYRRNAVLDLKMIKEREDDYETMVGVHSFTFSSSEPFQQMISEELMNENGGMDTPVSPDSASIT